jgi:ribosome maturation factor RimP
MNRSTSELELALAPVVAQAGAELVDVEVQSRVLQVTVEREAGLDLESLASISRSISDLLDEREDLAPSARYELEVSTPGLERRLRRPEHFQRAIGARISVRTEPGTTGARRIEAVLVGVDDTGISLEDKPGAAVVHVAYDEIERARTVFDWQAELASAKRARAGHDEGAESPASVTARTAAGIEADRDEEHAHE